MAHPEGTKIGARDPSKPFPKEPSNSSTAGALVGDAATKSNGVEDAEVHAEAPPFRLPPLSAIAGVLISDWANGKVVVGGVRTMKKGNL